MLNLLYNRRSIRKYTSEPIEKETIDQLIQAALLAPTSRNTQAWEFVIVDNKDTLEKLSAAKVGAQHIKGAPLAIVVCADPQKSDVWVEDTSIASASLLFTAQSLGLGACWIQIRERMHKDEKTAGDYVKEVLGIPNQYQVEPIIVLGYPNEKKSPHMKEELKYEKVHWNEY